MTPQRTLLFLLAVLLILGVVGMLIPKDGIRFGDAFTLHMPTPREVLLAERVEKVDISDILSLTTDEDAELELDGATIDSLAHLAHTEDTIPSDVLRFDPSRIPPLEERIILHYPDAGKAVLQPFFDALTKAPEGSKPIRIMHYGDSQLEGDRITSYIRNKLQVQFGGHGPGLVSIADIVPNFSVERVISDNWKRYSVMNRRDSSLTHDRYGAISSFSRFTEILPDSVAVDSTQSTGTITLRPMARSYARARSWNTCRLYYGWHRSPLTLTLSRNGEPFRTEVVPAGNRLHISEWRLPATSDEVTITLTGADSPDVFGVSLEGRSGVAMDNIAARGGAGYEFRKVDQALSKAMYTDLNVKLLILQYGGNVLPNIKSADEAVQYGRFFGAQIARFKKMLPGVCVIVIGPSDMSIKEGEYYVTRPFLEDVRDAMKENSLNQGAVFWDMYTAMGGRGSMASWVEADPPLAATDYTHFSPAGSKKVGELFYTALINDYAEYRASEGALSKSKKAAAPVIKKEKH